MVADQEPPRLGQTLEPGGQVYAFAIDIPVVRHRDVTQVKAEPEIVGSLRPILRDLTKSEKEL